MKLVSIVLVTWNSLRYLAWCREAILHQSFPRWEVIIVDNASTDGTREWLLQEWNEARSIFLDENLGFCKAVNIGIASAHGSYILLLNPDVSIDQEFIGTLYQSMESFPNAALMTGKLLRSYGPGRTALEPPVIDSTGIYFKRNLRHFDRGNGEVDRGQYEKTESVFGASGAAMFLRREVAAQIAIDGEFLDEDFFAFRDDADVSWRARLLGWEVLYIPKAVAYHVRQVLPDHRKETLAIINMHSVKNRFLMRFKNLSWEVLRRTFFRTLMRDFVIIAACLSIERTSLEGLVYVVRNLKRILSKRKLIFCKIPFPRPSLAKWFNDRPVSFPVDR